MESKWMLYTKRADFERISARFHISPVLARIMVNRDIKEEDFSLYLNNDLNLMHDAKDLYGVEDAYREIMSEIKKGKKIRVVGDYDIDGVCSSYILMKSLKHFGANVDVRIPDRIKDGYGINDNIINEAALRAVRDNRKFVIQSDLEESIEVVIAGYQKKNSILTDAEKWRVSYHEVGHALVAAKQTNSAPVTKITIIPRTSGALGYTMQVDEGNHYLMTKSELENKIVTLTGGRAAEEVVFGDVSTGASNDIEQATKLARAMITRYGMSKDFDMVALETVTNRYLGGDTSLAASAETAAIIDRQVVALVKEQHEKAAQILMENREKLEEISHFLYEKETITGDEFMEILNR